MSWRWALAILLAVVGLGIGYFSGEAPFGVEGFVLGEVLLIEFEGGAGSELLFDGKSVPATSATKGARNRLVYEPLPAGRDVLVALRWEGQILPVGSFTRGAAALRDPLQFAGKERATVHFQRPVQLWPEAGGALVAVGPGKEIPLAFTATPNAAVSVRWREHGIDFERRWTRAEAKREMVQSLALLLADQEPRFEGMMIRIGKTTTRKTGAPEDLDVFSDCYRIWESVLPWCPEFFAAPEESGRALWSLWIEWSKRFASATVPLRQVRPHHLPLGAPGSRSFTAPPWRQPVVHKLPLRMSRINKPPVPQEPGVAIILLPSKMPDFMSSVGYDPAYSKGHKEVLFDWPAGVPTDRPVAIKLTWSKAERYDMMRFGATGAAEAFAEFWFTGHKRPLDKRGPGKKRAPLYFVYPGWSLPAAGTEVVVAMSALRHQSSPTMAKLRAVSLSWDAED